MTKKVKKGWIFDPKKPVLTFFKKTGRKRAKRSKMFTF